MGNESLKVLENSLNFLFLKGYEPWIQFKWNIDLTTNIGVAIEDVLVWLLLSGRGGGGEWVGGGSPFLEFPGGPVCPQIFFRPVGPQFD